MDEEASRRGDLDITSDMIIMGTDSNNPSTIDGAGIDRVFHIRNSTSGSVTLRNLIVRGGDATSQSGTVFQLGGGVFVDGTSEVIVFHSTIKSNRAGNGGGIHIASQGQSGGRLLLLFSSVENNRAELGDGGLFVSMPVTIRNTIISGNRAVLGPGGLTLFAAGNDNTIEKSTISGNRGGRVGGVEIGQAFVKMTNVTFSGNSATEPSVGVGGISVQESIGLNLINATIVGNSGVVGGVAAVNTFVTNNSIIANNSGGDCKTGTLINGFTNLTGDFSCRFVIGVGNQRNTNPLLGPLALNGSGNNTRSHALLAGSPAMERGSSNSSCPATDQRDIRRPQGAGCDVGAFEKELRVVLGTPLLTPSAINVSAGQTITLSLSWTVPFSMTWRDLHTMDLQLETAETQVVVIRFSEGVTSTKELTDTDGFMVDSELSLTDGLTSSVTATPTHRLTLFDGMSEVGSDAIGVNRLLEGEVAALDLLQSRMETEGAEGKTVTLILVLRLNQPLAGSTLAATVIASDDAGNQQGPEPVGTVAVGPFDVYMPVISR